MIHCVINYDVISRKLIESATIPVCEHCQRNIIREFIIISCTKWNNGRVVATKNCLCGHLSVIILFRISGNKGNSRERLNSSPRQHIHAILYIVRLQLWKGCTVITTYYVYTLKCPRPTNTIMVLLNLPVRYTWQTNTSYQGGSLLLAG